MSLNNSSCFSPRSYDVRGNGVEIGRHWNDGVNLGARARFDERARPLPLLWLEDLRQEDQGVYRCRVDFKQAPTRNVRISLDVIGEIFFIGLLSQFSARVAYQLLMINIGKMLTESLFFFFFFSSCDKNKLCPLFATPLMNELHFFAPLFLYKHELTSYAGRYA